MINAISMVLVLLSLLPVGAIASSPTASPYSWTFEELGWTEDVVVTASSPAVVSLELPPEARQGDSLWHGLELAFQLEGSPGEVDDFVSLGASWNGKAVYQFKTKRVAAPRYRWSMVDMIGGSKWGHELTDTISVRSSNIAQLEAVRGGRNDLNISLRLSGASNKDVRAVISRSSRVFATAWRPPEIHGSTEGDVTGQVLDLRADIQNLGWGAPQLWASVVGWNGRDRETHSFDLGPMAPLGRFEFQERVALKHPPDRVDLVLDWGGGRQFYVVWDSSEPPSFPFHLPVFRSTLGLVVAVIALWLVVPMLWTSLRRRRT